MTLKVPQVPGEYYRCSSRYAGLIFSRCLYSLIAMSTKTRVTEESRTPVVTPRNRTRSLSNSDEEVHLSPVQRMRGKISLSDPEIIRRIIFDPSLEP